MPQWQVSDWLTAVGWPVTFVLGVAATVVAQRLLRKKSLLAWSILNESTLFPADVSSELGLPVAITVDQQQHRSLSVVKLVVGSAGNEVIRDATLHIHIGASARLLRFRPTSTLGAYREKISWTSASNGEVLLHFEFINPDVRRIEFELVLGDFVPGDLHVDMAVPGTLLVHREPSNWNMASLALGKSLALSVMGVRYDPTVAVLSEIVDELRAIRAARASLPGESTEKRRG